LFLTTLAGLTVPQEPSIDRPSVIAEYGNVNKFLAHLMTTNVPVFNFSIFCLWAMRAALETPMVHVRPDHDTPDITLPAAAAWISIAGVQMYGWDEEFPHGPKVGAPGSGGPLWNGKHGFCKERWHLWSRRFGELASSDSDKITDDLRTIAKQAETRMAEIEAGEA